MFSVVGNAQTSKLGAEQNSIVSAQMVVLVHASKMTYLRGMSLTEWIRQTGPTNPNKNEIQLLTKTYQYVSNGTADCEIMNSDNSILYTVVSSPISDTPNTLGRWCWKCILTAIKEIMEVIINHLS